MWSSDKLTTHRLAGRVKTREGDGEAMLSVTGQGMQGGGDEDVIVITRHPGRYLLCNACDSVTQCDRLSVTMSLVTYL